MNELIKMSENEKISVIYYLIFGKPNVKDIFTAECEPKEDNSNLRIFIDGNGHSLDQFRMLKLGEKLYKKLSDIEKNVMDSAISPQNMINKEVLLKIKEIINSTTDNSFPA